MSNILDFAYKNLWQPEETTSVFVGDLDDDDVCMPQLLPGYCSGIEALEIQGQPATSSSADLGSPKAKLHCLECAILKKG